MTADPDQWLRRALCRYVGHPTDWDDTLDTGDDKRREPAEDRAARHKRAKAVCARCPVQIECANSADMWTDSGIWAGISLEEWRKEQRRNPTATNYVIVDIGRRSA